MGMNGNELGEMSIGDPHLEIIFQCVREYPFHICTGSRVPFSVHFANVSPKHEERTEQQSTLCPSSS